MKPYAKLTRADLEQFPIWEWVLEEDDPALDEAHDESYVQATELTNIPELSFAQFVSAATIELKDGSRMPGIAEVTVAEGSVAIQPTTVFLLDRHLQIPGVETNRLLTRYTKSLENYPVAWQLAVLVQGEKSERTGKIAGGDMKDLVAIGMQALLALKSLRKQ